MNTSDSKSVFKEFPQNSSKLVQLVIPPKPLLKIPKHWR